MILHHKEYDTNSLNTAAGLSGTAGDISTMLFGSGSGGLTAELTGEDGALRKCPVDIFSERASMRRESQGAATGLAVSALNHVAHREVVKRNFKQILRDNEINPNANPGNTVEELINSANTLLELDVYKDIKGNLKGADIEYEFGGVGSYKTPDGKTITLSEGGLMTANGGNSYKINIYQGSISKMWKFGFVLGKELYMVGLINNGTYNGWINQGRTANWAAANLEVQSYRNWVLLYTPSQLGLHNSNYNYWLRLRDRN